MNELSTLCYIEHNGKYLMLHRIKKKNDVNHDKWIGPGGHFEQDESPEECMVREVYEETGIILTDYRFRGIVTFVSGNGVTEYMHLFTAHCDFTESRDSASASGDSSAVISTSAAAGLQESSADAGLQESSAAGERSASDMPLLPACSEGVLEWVSIEDVWNLNLWEGDKIFFRLLDENVPFFSLKLVYDGKDGLVSAVLNGKPLELFDIIDEEGNPTGLVKERGVAHRDGSRHATVHMWIVRPNEKSGYDVLLQRRSYTKDSHPGLLDISSAGHIEHGSAPLAAAVRELSEELGITAQPEDLRPIGTFEVSFRGEFGGFPYIDNELSYEYLYDKPVDADLLTLQESEVDSVMWIDLAECLDRVRSGELEHCLYEEELLLVENALQ